MKATEKEIMNGDKLIALFLEWKFCRKSSGTDKHGEYDLPSRWIKPEKGFIGWEEELKFHSDYNYIMQAWEAIAALKCDNIYIDEMTISSRSCSIKAYTEPYNKQKKCLPFYVIGDVVRGRKLEKLIDCIFLVIVEFVEWYNSQNK